MSNYILKYTRDQRVKYISHLDFIRLFHRTVRRSGVQFVFSRGFNPHPVMTVAMPLSVGVTSGGEYMKAGFCDDYPPEEIKDRINRAFPPGFSVTEIHKLAGKEIDLNKISKADYTVEIELCGPREPDLEAFMAFDQLLVMKKSKSGEKEADIRPHIDFIRRMGKEGNVLTLKMRLSCGNAYNLKPETVVEAMEKYLNIKSSFICVHRDTLLFA